MRIGEKERKDKSEVAVPTKRQPPLFVDFAFCNPRYFLLFYFTFLFLFSGAAKGKVVLSRC
jgi:hypothetical protein